MIAPRRNRCTKRADKLSIALRVVVYREAHWWLAHCLEMDLVAEGNTPESALRDLHDICRLQIKLGMERADLDSVFRAAPAEYLHLFTGQKEPRCR